MRSLQMVLVAMLVTAPSASAQGREFRGTVVDSSNRPIAGALVSTISRSVSTDDSGSFRFAGVRIGDTLRLSIRALGFVPHAVTLVVAQHVPTFRLQRAKVPQTLAPVTVEAKWAKPARYNATAKFDEFYRRRALGQGHFFTREDLERTSRTEAAYMLQGLGGVRLYPPRMAQKPMIKLSRCPYQNGLALFIDGQQVGTSLTAAEELFDMHLNDVEAMEVYTSQSQLPQEAVGVGCAAVFIWTRYTRGSVLKPRADTLKPH